MIPALKIIPSAALNTRAVRKIFSVLNQGAKKQHHVLMVGGCVRDAILGLQGGDIDFATIHKPRDVIKRFKAEKIKVIPTGLDHGTITVVIDDHAYQITTLRRDVETDGRHAVVAFSTNWIDDALRRDFTCNTLLMDVRGNIYDVLGRGVADLKQGRIIFVGDAAGRIVEDYLRILRFYRFYARFGKLKLDLRTIAAIKKHKNGLKKISAERITDEVLKILKTEKAFVVFSLMHRHGVLLQVVLKKLAKIDIKLFTTLNKKFNERDHAFFLAKFLLVMNHKSKQLRLSNKMTDDLVKVKKLSSQIKIFDAVTLRKLLYLHGRDISFAAMVLYGLTNKTPRTILMRALNYLDKTEIPAFPWRGQDLIDLGIAPGPRIKNALKKLERAWIKDGLS